MPLISDSEIWFSKKKGNKTQQGQWNSYVEISEELFLSLKKNPIPINWEVVLEIRTNPTALDFYALLTYESAKIMKKVEDAKKKNPSVKPTENSLYSMGCLARANGE